MDLNQVDRKEKFEKMKSRFGNITCDGSPDSPSFSISPKDEDFWEYIEEGIKPLVELFYIYDLTTVSSCQGHFYDDGYNKGSGRSEFPNIKFLSNDTIDRIVFNALDKLDIESLIYERAEFVKDGYTSHITFLVDYDPEEIKRLLGILEDTLAEAFEQNKEELKRAIKVEGYHRRKNFDKLEKFMSPDQLYNPDDYELDSYTRVQLIKYLYNQEDTFHCPYTEPTMEFFQSLKGEYGNITIDGKPGSVSPIIQMGDIDFWHFIEPDIKPLVRVFQDFGLITVGSCEGHEYSTDDDKKSDEWSVNAHVRYVTSHLLNNLIEKVMEGLDFIEIAPANYLHGHGHTSQITFKTINDREKLKEEIQTAVIFLEEGLLSREEELKHCLKYGY